MNLLSFLKSKTHKAAPRPLHLFNTLSKKKEEFEPISLRHVKMYNCGPTVYDVQTIGNLRPPVSADVLKRTLSYNGYAVKQVTNITDVGCLTSDADEGEDKMSKGLRREGKEINLKNMRALGTKIFEDFLQGFRTAEY